MTDILTRMRLFKGRAFPPVRASMKAGGSDKMAIYEDGVFLYHHDGVVYRGLVPRNGKVQVGNVLLSTTMNGAQLLSSGIGFTDSFVVPEKTLRDRLIDEELPVKSGDKFLAATNRRSLYFDVVDGENIVLKGVGTYAPERASNGVLVRNFEGTVGLPRNVDIGLLVKSREGAIVGEIAHSGSLSTTGELIVCARRPFVVEYEGAHVFYDGGAFDEKTCKNKQYLIPQEKPWAGLLRCAGETIDVSYDNS